MSNNMRSREKLFQPKLASNSLRPQFGESHLRMSIKNMLNTNPQAVTFLTRV